MLAALRDGASLEDEAVKLGLKAEESPMISRVDRAGSKLPPDLLEVALSLTAAAPYPETVVTSGQTLYVAAFKDEKKASDEKFEEKKDEIGKRLIAENKNAIQGSWVAFLRDRAEVEIDSRF
jgi:hypothetical protein